MPSTHCATPSSIQGVSPPTSAAGKSTPLVQGMATTLTTRPAVPPEIPLHASQGAVAPRATADKRTKEPARAAKLSGRAAIPRSGTARGRAASNRAPVALKES